MNALTTSNGTGNSIAVSEKNFFESYADTAVRNKIVGDYLRFAKGDWVYGKDQREIPVGTRVIVCMDDFFVGWVKWQDSKPVDSRTGRISEGFRAPSRHELGDEDKDQWETDEQSGRPRDPWQMTNTVYMVEEKGDRRLFTFSTSSKGGITALAKLTGEYGRMLRQKPDAFPVVALKVESYMHPKKELGRIKTPVFEVVGWTAKAPVIAAIAGGVADAEADEEAAAEREAPAKRGPGRPAKAHHADEDAETVF